MSTSGGGGKAPQSGLVDMGEVNFYNDPSDLITFTLSDLANYPGSFSEIVLNVTWAQLQAVQDGPLDTAFIESAISAVNAYNAANASDLGIKLRVWGGFTAPDWAKNIDGPAVTITGPGTIDPNLDTTDTIGRFWTADYIDAWTSFQSALATIYDSNPVIRGISNTAGASATDEPFVPLKFIPVNQVAMLQNGGYTDAAQQLTLRAAIADYAKWSATPLDYTMNLFHLYDSGNDMADENFTLAVLQQAKNSTRVVQAGNHALNAPPSTADSFIYSQMAGYAALDLATAPGSYQTASPTNLGGFLNWTSAVLQGVGADTGNIELWDGPALTGFLGLSPGDVQALAAIVAAGIAPVTAAPADGSALGFIAPAFVASTPGKVAFSGVDAVLLASGTTQPFYTVTVTSLTGATLGVTDVYGTVKGPTSGSTLTLSGQLPIVNTVLASLTETLATGKDVVRITATDGHGNAAVRDVGVQISPVSDLSGASPTGGAASPVSANDVTIAQQLAGNGILLVGGVRGTMAAGNLDIGVAGGTTTLLAALAPSAYSTASLTVGGTLAVHGGGTALFTGSLGASRVTIDSRGTISGDGTLSASSGEVIVNNGTIEAVADFTLGLQRLTVANALSGSGRLLIDPGASLVLAGAVSAQQTVDFSPNSIAQFSNAPYSPSTLVLRAPQTMQGTIRGFSFADRLVLDGVTATAASYDVVNGRLTVDQQGGGSLSFALSGDLAGLVPVLNSANTIAFVAPASGARPSVAAPDTLEGAAATPVLVPSIVLKAPFPAIPPANQTITVTLAAGSGTLSAVTPTGSISLGSTITFSGTLDAVERSLQTLTYLGVGASDAITITASDYAGVSASKVISVFNNSAPVQFDWSNSSGGSFADPANWTTNGTIENTPPGGTNVAAFSPGLSGAYTVFGDGAVGQILATGTLTLTGHVTAQGRGGVALIVDSGGALAVAGGAELSVLAQATVGATGQGLLTLMGGALSLSGPTTSNALVIGQSAGSYGTVLNFEQITANGTVVVGQAGTGTLELLGVAATVTDGTADIGQSAGAQGIVSVNGGYWATSGQLTVGDLGNGTLLIDGRANGITGQVTAFDATIAGQRGSQGSVTLAGGNLLVSDSQGPASTLIVGGAGSGSLAITNSSEVAVGVVGSNDNGMLVVGGTAGGTGQIRIGDGGALLVFGDATVGGASGAGSISMGFGPRDDSLFATSGALEVKATGQLTLQSTGATIRASVLDIDSGGLITGTGTLSGTVGGNNTIMFSNIDNDGSIVASGGNLLLYGSVTGTGQLSVANGATLTLQAAVGAGQTLSFGSNAHAVLADPRAFSGNITGFASGDVLELASVHGSKATWAAGILTVDTDAGALRLKLAGTYASDAFAVQSDGLGGTNVLMANDLFGSVYSA